MAQLGNTKWRTSAFIFIGRSQWHRVWRTGLSNQIVDILQSWYKMNFLGGRPKDGQGMRSCETSKISLGRISAKASKSAQFQWNRQCVCILHCCSSVSVRVSTSHIASSSKLRNQKQPCGWHKRLAGWGVNFCLFTFRLRILDNLEKCPTTPTFMTATHSYNFAKNTQLQHNCALIALGAKMCWWS